MFTSRKPTNKSCTGNVIIRDHGLDDPYPIQYVRWLGRLLKGDWGWGDILVESRNWIIGAGGNPLSYWWVFVPATIALIFFSVGWNLLGDGLSDVLNPFKDYRLIGGYSTPLQA